MGFLGGFWEWNEWEEGRLRILLGCDTIKEDFGVDWGDGGFLLY